MGVHRTPPPLPAILRRHVPLQPGGKAKGWGETNPVTLARGPSATTCTLLKRLWLHFRLCFGAQQREYSSGRGCWLVASHCVSSDASLAAKANAAVEMVDSGPMSCFERTDLRKGRAKAVVALRPHFAGAGQVGQVTRPVALFCRKDATHTRACLFRRGTCLLRVAADGALRSHQGGRHEGNSFRS